MDISIFDERYTYLANKIYRIDPRKKLNKNVTVIVWQSLSITFGAQNTFLFLALPFRHCFFAMIKKASLCCQGAY